MIKIRSIPYPYEAMLTICSDLDETADAETYIETIRYLNTESETKHGIGVGLELGNTIYFDMPSNQFAYWNASDEDRKKVRTLIRSGHIDCFHSFGDFTTKREQVKKHLTELANHDCKLSVWIDHAIAPTNIDQDIMCGEGGEPGAQAYHTDLTIAHGVKYVWLGRVTSVVGQDVKRKLVGIFTFKYPISSLITLLKEILKGILPNFGNSKYVMHAKNKILQKRVLADGGEVWEFLRSNPCPLGVSSYETGDGIGELIRPNFLDQLISRRGKCILYTHLGKLKDPSNKFSRKTQEAFELLRDYGNRKTILVTTTCRLLDYTRMTECVEINHTLINGQLKLDLKNADGLPLTGLSIVAGRFSSVEVLVNGDEKKDFSCCVQGENTIIQFPWVPLTFPKI